MEPVTPEIPSLTAPRTYALIDTVEGLEHWIEAAEQSGVVAIWPETSAVAGARRPRSSERGLRFPWAWSRLPSGTGA